MENQTFLETVYEKLDFRNGSLVNVADQPDVKINQDEWLDKGEWLLAGKRAGADKIFFIDNNPVVVFAKCHKNDQAIIDCYNRLWSLSRPRILFLETDGELSVFDLAQPPVHWKNDKTAEKQQRLQTLSKLEQITDVAKVLQAYHRDNVESGKVFEQHRFGDLKHRADQALIADLKTVRRKLREAGLDGNKIQYAHALIGRSIFIRYLEDRGILDEDYFRKVARQKTGWTDFLSNPSTREKLNFSEIRAFYPRVLQDKDFTYALFKALSKDFNGDMFPGVDAEEQVVEFKHLKLIQDLLYGDVGVQQKLFFFSYKFDVIPLELISAIYEEFYHSASSGSEEKSKARQDGAYYTPPALAEFTLSRVLTKEALRENPRVLDPACGSGIFLVEAFRRMVRYKWKQRQTALEFDELKNILSRQIIGVEVNDEAARITAFSLYLAMLHYIDPPSIQKHIRNGNKLPNLLVSEKKSSNHYDSIYVGNAFGLEKEKLGDVDIIVGNPPWGAPNKKTADKETRARHKVMLNWCASCNFPIGDEEPSQAFLWRAADLLKPGGKCAMLTSAGVLLKHSATTQSFRREWMKQVCIQEVFNFTHVRKFFFQGAVSPFVMILFSKSDQNNTPVEYWSAKQVASLKETQTVLLSKYDRAYLVKQDLTNNKVWKTNWFGRHADAIFISQLFSRDKLADIVDRAKSGQGYKKSPAENEYPDVSCLPSLVVGSFDRYSEPSFERAPKKFHRAGIQNIYHGRRLLVQRGIYERGERKGTIVSRFETEDYCFTNAINGLKLIEDTEQNYLLILGLFWSSFSRYFYFNVSANWGLWHHEIHLDDELLQLPIPQHRSKHQAKKVISIVEKLRNYDPAAQDLIAPGGTPLGEINQQRHEWEAELDEAVFDLYGFSNTERDLIRDCCDVTLPFFYQPYKSIGSTVAVDHSDDLDWIKQYAQIFAAYWQSYLSADDVLRADLHIGASGNMIALEFYPADKTDTWNLKPKTNSWSYVMKELSGALTRPVGTSQILLEGVVHAISDNSIIIIKRNEKRFWTRSIAREDAEASLCKRMVNTMPRSGGIE